MEHQAGLGTVVREWGRIGCVGFGGPPAHIALLRQLCVGRRRWLDAQEFEDAIAACNLLPGPASTELAIFCAWRVRGRAGALAGGLAFILPGLACILALSALFLAGTPPLWVKGAGAGAGAAVAAVAVVFSHFQFDMARYVTQSTGLPNLVIGNAGVDLFFVISGFVIVYASEQLFAQPAGQWTFLQHRLIRIAPLYWIVTAVYIAIAFAALAFGFVALRHRANIARLRAGTEPRARLRRPTSEPGS